MLDHVMTKMPELEMVDIIALTNALSCTPEIQEHFSYHAWFSNLDKGK